MEFLMEKQEVRRSVSIKPSGSDLLNAATPSKPPLFATAIGNVAKAAHEEEEEEEDIEIERGRGGGGKGEGAV